MEGLTIAIICVLVVVGILVYVVFNLLRKNERLEEKILIQDEYLISLENTLDDFMESQKEVLEKYNLKDDEELGGMYRPLFSLSQQLKNYKKALNN
jgi:hypothetical protein